MSSKIEYNTGKPAHKGGNGYMNTKERMKIARQMPVELEVEKRITNFDEIIKGFEPESAMLEAQRCLQCKKPLCMHGCPLYNNIPLFIRYIGEGEFEKAYWEIRKTSSMPAVCSRVCPHEFQCEGACVRGKGKGQPVAIGMLERFVVDWIDKNKINKIVDCPKPIKKKVAIIGSGPASMSVAYFLSLRGIMSEVFEARDIIGGMLSLGIPPFRLPRDVIEREFEYLIHCGVRINTNTRIGEDLSLDDIKARGFDAVFLGVGAHSSKKLGLKGENSTEGVLHGINYLSRVFSGEPITLGRRVVVVGGGNVAIDVARTALRMGSEDVFILYRRTRAEMPASEKEIHHLEEEGIRIQMLAAPVRIISENGKLTEIECERMELGDPDESGRRRPVVQEGMNFRLKADALIPAISQIVEHSAVKGKRFKKTSWGTYETNPATLQTSVPWVFAGGDDVMGPQTIAKAAFQGRVAAESIELYLRGVDTNINREFVCQLPESICHI